MRLKTIAIILAVLTPVLAYVAWFAMALTASEGELVEKAPWTALQSVEYEDRGNLQAGPIIRKVDNNYTALGVPGVGEPVDGQTDPPASRRMWILLNEHFAPRRVRTLNAYPKYDLSCLYVDQLKARVPDIDDYVLRYLRTLCSPEPVTSQ